MKLMDGAMGTFLLQHGYPLGACLEALNLERSSLISEIHRSYVKAGAEAIVSNTFGANRMRLQTHRQTRRLEAINRQGVSLAKEAAGKRLVFASIGPLGVKRGEIEQKKMRSLFGEQARYLEKEKPDGYLIETMISLEEAEAAVSAVREISDRPVMALMTFPRKSPRHFSKKKMEAICKTLRSAGAGVIGLNCGTGPEEVYDFFKIMIEVDPGPFCVRPSAGLPGKLVTPEKFAAWGIKFQKRGCQWFGGCCGTTPAHIRALNSLII